MPGIARVSSQSAGRVRGGISPLRRQVLEALATPASAAAVAVQLGMSRQRVAYHVRELEQAGLVQVVEERTRRGCIERIVRATASAVVVGPDIIGDLATVSQDRFAADTLVAISARAINELALLSERAEASGRRLVTFAIEADVGFSTPADIERFGARLAEAVTRLVAEFDSGRPEHRFRVVLGSYPKPRTPSPTTVDGDSREDEGVHVRDEL